VPTCRPVSGRGALRTLSAPHAGGRCSCAGWDTPPGGPDATSTPRRSSTDKRHSPALQPTLGDHRTAADNWATTTALPQKDQAARFAQINSLWLQGACQFWPYVLPGTHSCSALHAIAAARVSGRSLCKARQRRQWAVWQLYAGSQATEDCVRSARQSATSVVGRGLLLPPNAYPTATAV